MSHSGRQRWLARLRQAAVRAGGSGWRAYLSSQPIEGAADECGAVLKDGRSMSQNDLFGWPSLDARERGACGFTVYERRAELAGHLGVRPRHQVEPRDKRAPAPEPAGLELLEQI